jgi:hypothetical protein
MVQPKDDKAVRACQNKPVAKAWGATGMEHGSGKSAPPAPHDVPTIFIDGYHGVQIANGAARLNLVQEIYPPDPVSGQDRKVVARLVMGLPTLLALRSSLDELIGDIERHYSEEEVHGGGTVT